MSGLPRQPPSFDADILLNQLADDFGDGDGQLGALLDSLGDDPTATQQLPSRKPTVANGFSETLSARIVYSVAKANGASVMKATGPV